MSKMRHMLLVGTALILGGCSGKSEYQLMQTSTPESTLRQNSVNVSDRSIEYLILPQDRVEITLYKDPQSASQGSGSSAQGLGQSMSPNGLLVDASGYVPLPLIGKVKIAGLTQTQAADRITNEYKKYLNTPSVYVEVLNKRILVLGEVKSPGVVKLDREKITLFEALAMSGDFTDAAVRDSIMILSNSKDKGMVARTVDLTNLDTMRYASLMLRPNDIVYVKPNAFKQFGVGASQVLSPLDPILKLATAYVVLDNVTK